MIARHFVFFFDWFRMRGTPKAFIQCSHFGMTPSACFFTMTRREWSEISADRLFFMNSGLRSYITWSQWACLQAWAQSKWSGKITELCRWMTRLKRFDVCYKRMCVCVKLLISILIIIKIPRSVEHICKNILLATFKVCWAPCPNFWVFREHSAWCIVRIWDVKTTSVALGSQVGIKNTRSQVR